MADKSAPVVPAVSSFDPVEWTKKIEGQIARINNLESDKQDLQREIDTLNSRLVQQTSVAASARGSMMLMKEDLQALRGQLAESDNLKELARLRIEVSSLHTATAKAEKARAEEDRKAKMQLQDLSARAARAEGKFQALEGTATMMAQARDKANLSAATLLAERDAALKTVEALTEDLAQFRAEFVKVKGDFDRAQAEVKALRQAPAAQVKAQAQ